MILIIKAPVAISMPRYMYRLLSSPVLGFGTGGLSVFGSGGVFSVGAGGINLSFNMVNPLSALPSYKTLKRLSPDSK